MTDDRNFNNEDDEMFFDDDINVDVTEEIEDIEAEYSYDEEEKVVMNRNKKNKKILIPVVAAIIVLCIIAGILIVKLVPNNEYADLYKFFGVTKGSDEVAVVLNHELTKEDAYYRDGIVYLDTKFVEANITDKFYYDSNNNCYIYTTATEIWTIPVGSSEYTIGDELHNADYPIFIEVDGWDYIAVDFIEGKADFTYEVYSDPARISIVLPELESKSVVFGKYVNIRDGKSIKSEIVAYTKGVETDWYASDYNEDSKWTYVVAKDGRAGYVQTKYIESTSPFKLDHVRQEEYPNQLRDYDICLVWDAIYSEADNSKIADDLAETSGITTVSPTWYKVIDEKGTISSMADVSYVEYIHSLGMEIWPLVSDFTSKDEWSEKELFSNTESRRNLIANLMNEIITYGYDGINIDFELVPNEDNTGADYVQFIRELSIECRKAGVVLSIDVAVPRSFNEHYGRKALAECADYVIMMGYDEHYSGGSTAGSTASISFVTEGLDDSLKVIPKEKLIAGIPFYTRLWKEDVDENGNLKLTSTACSMDDAWEKVSELGLEYTWDDTVKQTVAEGLVDGVYYSIWIEDENSMKARIEAIRERDVAGVAAWALGFERSSIWEILE